MLLDERLRRRQGHEQRRVQVRFAKFLAAAVVVSAVASHPTLAQNAADNMSFFLTSAGPGNGANLGGLTGADQHCQKLAQSVGAGSRTWRAYLSTSASDGAAAVNARDRIGQGPWHNSKGVAVALNVTDLHSDKNNLTK